MFDYSAAIAAVQDASAEHRDRQKRESMPHITTEDANAEVRAMIAAAREWYAPTMRERALSAVEKLADNEAMGLGRGLPITSAD